MRSCLVARPGRRRKSGPRDSKGRLMPKKAKDRGTNELQKRRAWLAGQGDPNQTSYPLGVLLANGAIEEAEHKAGCEYAWLHAVVFGRMSVAAAQMERLGRSYQGDWNDEWLAARVIDLKDMVMKLSPARMKMALDNLVVYERAPRFMLPVFQRPSDVRESALIREGLQLLAKQGQPLDRAA